MKKTIHIILVFLMISAMSSFTLADSAWLHVNVDDDEDQININLPIVLAEAVVTLVELSDEPTVIKIEDQEITVPEMREIWEVLKSEGSFTLATIRSKSESGGDNIDINFENNRLLITGETGDEEIDINISGTLIDALLSGEKDNFNLEACIEELKLMGTDAGYVHIKGNDGDTVRLWVDNNRSAE